VLVDCSQLLATPDADEVAKGLERLQLIDSDDGVSPTEDHQNTGGSTRARPAYQGHYILLLGFDLTNKRVFFHDPSPSGKVLHDSVCLPCAAQRLLYLGWNSLSG